MSTTFACGASRRIRLKTSGMAGLRPNRPQYSVSRTTGRLTTVSCIFPLDDLRLVNQNSYVNSAATLQMHHTVTAQCALSTSGVPFVCSLVHRAVSSQPSDIVVVSAVSVNLACPPSIAHAPAPPPDVRFIHERTRDPDTN
jgi:hypothetical protein